MINSNSIVAQLTSLWVLTYLDLLARTHTIWKWQIGILLGFTVMFVKLYQAIFLQFNTLQGYGTSKREQSETVRYQLAKMASL